MEFTIALPEDLWSNPLNLLYIFVITVPYGLLTHWTSLPAIKKFNRKERVKYQGQPLPPACILIVFLYRMTAQLPVRILSSILGVVLSIAVILIGGIWFIITAIAGEPQMMRIRKIIMGWKWKQTLGWQWRQTPKELQTSWSGWDLNF